MPSSGLEKTTWMSKADLVMAPQPPSAKNGTLQSGVDITDERDRCYGPPPPKRYGNDDCEVSFTECMRTIGLTAAAAEDSNGIWCQRSLSLATKFCLYSTCMMHPTHIPICGVETWTLTSAKLTKLKAFDINIQRRILGIKWYDAFAQGTKLQDVGDIASQRRTWLLAVYLLLL